MEIKILYSNMDEIEDKYVSLSETRNKINQLSKIDYVKLMQIASYFTSTRLLKTIISPEDLFHEAVLRTLNGKRRWRKTVSIIRHLERVMESISSHEVKKLTMKNTISSIDMNCNTFSIVDNNEYSDTVNEEIDKILMLFKDDKIAVNIISFKADGFSASEIRSKLGIEKLEYESCLKRIRRRIIKYTRKKEE